MALKFSQIFKQVIKYAPTQLKNATYAKIKTFKGFAKDENDRIWAYAITYSTKVYDAKTGLWVRKPIEYYDTFIAINKKGGVILSCSCDDFKYRHEVALHKKGASEIEYSNGQAPIVTNPREHWTCCKHCLRFYKVLSEKDPDIYPPVPDLNRI